MINTISTDNSISLSLENLVDLKKDISSYRCGVSDCRLYWDGLRPIVEIKENEDYFTQAKQILTKDLSFIVDHDWTKLSKKENYVLVRIVSESHRKDLLKYVRREYLEDSDFIAAWTYAVTMFGSIISHIKPENNISPSEYYNLCLIAIKRNGANLEFINKSWLANEHYNELVSMSLAKNASNKQYIGELCAPLNP